MKKRVLLLLTLIVSFAPMLGAKELNGFIPKGMDLVLYVDSVKLESYQALKDNKNAIPGMGDYDKEYRIFVPHLKEFIFAGKLDGSVGGVLARTTLAESSLPAKLKEAKIDFRVDKSSGKNVYWIEKKRSIADQNVKVGLLYLDKDVLLAGEQKQFARFLAAQQKGADAGIFDFSKTGTVKVFFNARSMGKDDIATQFLGGASALYGVIDITGQTGEKQGVKVSAFADCADKQSAQNFMNMCRMWSLMAVNMAFAEKPELGQELVKNLKFSSGEKQASANLALSDDLLNKMQVFFKDKIE